MPYLQGMETLSIDPAFTDRSNLHWFLYRNCIVNFFLICMTDCTELYHLSNLCKHFYMNK